MLGTYHLESADVRKIQTDLTATRKALAGKQRRWTTLL
jgi:hypothetical protein